MYVMINETVPNNIVLGIRSLINSSTGRLYLIDSLDYHESHYLPI